MILIIQEYKGLDPIYVLFQVNYEFRSETPLL